MTTRVLLIGGYGNFGSFIARLLSRDENIQLIIAGRNEAKARALAQSLDAKIPAQASALDITQGFASALSTINPEVVIHTSGPFQDQGYDVAQACISQGCNYLDLADGRAFVTGITALDAAAKAQGVLVCAGASSVPCLTSAIIDAYRHEFATLEEVEYAIATAQRTNRGLATIRAVLSYAGKPFPTLIDGEMRPVYGWMGLTWRRFWRLNLRPMGNCDVPDLVLFPQRYPELKTLRFRAGLELKIIHLTLVALSSLVRVKLLPSLQPLSKFLLKASYFFDTFGKDNSGFYMDLKGVGPDGAPKKITFDLVARDGDGLCIPTVPAILLARKLANAELTVTGAKPCLDLITLEEYLEVLSEFDIEWKTTR
jgi:NAD(P)-dependent dehydrogenase (short-subunit alcohol dehydrogenase family)